MKVKEQLPMNYRSFRKNLELKKKDILEKLKGNPKIRIEEDSKFYFKPLHDVRNIEELLDLINLNVDGIDKSDLIDSYRTIENDMKILVDAKKILKVTNTVKNTEILYPNEPDLMIELYPNIREQWKKVKLPAEADLQEEMFRVGLKKTIEKEKVLQLKRPAKEKKRNKKRKLNFHNNHIHDIDFQKELESVTEKHKK